MSLIYYVGETPVFEQEASEKLYSGELSKFDNAVKNGTSFEINVENGILKSDDSSFQSFEPIGIGKPLSIEILNVYSGDAPERFLGKKDLLVVSGVKSVATYDAAPKAINQIIEKLNDKKHYKPSAFNNGSSIVYYTPALDMGTVLCSFELVADSFNEEIFESVSGLLSKAGGIPVFAPATGVLLAGSVLANMASKLGKAIFESKPFFKGDFNIILDSPGQILTKANHIAIIDSNHTNEFINYIPKTVTIGNVSEIKLVNKLNDKPYSGDAPYVLISVDGRKRDDLKAFAPTLASASIIEKFYGADTGTQSIEVIKDAMELYNDYSYYKKAIKQKEKIEKLDSSSKEYKDGETLLGAYLENIDSELFKTSLNS
tara:strand:+ start:1304 stop:2422 length:1119 start_codon:yes stop_codon:yes gene_type:complete